MCHGCYENVAHTNNICPMCRIYIDEIVPIFVAKWLYSYIMLNNKFDVEISGLSSEEDSILTDFELEI